MNVATDPFAAIQAFAGTWAAAALLLERVTRAPPAGAGAFNISVAIEEVAPTTAVGLTATAPRTADVPGNTEKLALCVAPYVPDMVSDVLLVTELLVTVKVAVVAFGTTVTLAAT